jgi:transposase InsO family protein
LWEVQHVLFAFVYLLLCRMIRPIRGSDSTFDDKVELAVLRHQLAVVKRQVGRPALCHRDRLFMALMSRVLPRDRWSSFLVTPSTLLRWHRELVRRKWTFRRRSISGRPPISPEVRDLILRFARENPRWGCVRIGGELAKLGIKVSTSKIRGLLRASGLGPAPRRGGPTWGQFLRAQARGILGVDFFTVETAFLQTLYVLFAIELQSRRVTIVGVTRNPNSSWVTQQARNLLMELDDRHQRVRFLIHDRDAKFCGPFDELFRSEGVKIIETPVRAPRANAFAERRVRTARSECLDWLLVVGRRHLERVLRAYTEHYNNARPHRGLGLLTPDHRPAPPPWACGARVGRRDILGGLIHEYERAA